MILNIISHQTSKLNKPQLITGSPGTISFENLQKILAKSKHFQPKKSVRRFFINYSLQITLIEPLWSNNHFWLVYFGRLNRSS